MYKFVPNLIIFLKEKVNNGKSKKEINAKLKQQFE